MPEVMIRPARFADDAVLADLDRRCWSTLHAVTPRPGERAPFFGTAHGPDRFLVAGTGGRIAGYVGLVPPTPLAANAHVRRIQGFVVDGWARGRGVGRALLAAAVDEARRQGAHRITLRVLGHNAPARRLYEAMGFVVEGVLPQEFLLDGAFVDDVLMGRTTGRSASTAGGSVPPSPARP